ncbi:Tol-Pal system beta propeller repeat protein TolB [Desulforhopalus sp. 52FAK]
MPKLPMNKTFLVVLLSLLYFFVALPVSGAERVYLDISTTETRKIKIAVPWFQNTNMPKQKQKLGRDVADTLAKALKFHGIISIIPTSNYGGTQDANWASLGADYAILGNYSPTASAIKFEMRLYDVAGKEVIMGKTFSGSLQQKDKILFKFCDSVIESLTGMPGIAATRIAFVNRVNNVKEVYLTDILGRQVRQVTRHKHLTVSPRFVPKSNALTYSSYHTGNQNLYITDLSQSKTTRALSRRKGLNLAPAWSPDGRFMVLTLSKNGTPDLYLTDNKGKIIDQLTSRAGINVSPTWSPDGNHIVFTSDRSGKPQLYIMDYRTRKVSRLTYEGSENAEASWSPTENLIVYSSLRDGVYQLFTMDPLQKSSPQQVTEDLSHHESPSWSPDGQQIIFAKRDGKRNQIYCIMKNGSYQRRIFTLSGSQTYPQWSR